MIYILLLTQLKQHFHPFRPVYVCLQATNVLKKKQQQEMHTFVCTLVLSIVSSNCVQKGKPSSDQDKEDVTELKQNKQQLRNMAEMKSENW